MARNCVCSSERVEPLAWNSAVNADSRLDLRVRPGGLLGVLFPFRPWEASYGSFWLLLSKHVELLTPTGSAESGCQGAHVCEMHTSLTCGRRNFCALDLEAMALPGASQRNSPRPPPGAPPNLTLGAAS